MLDRYHDELSDAFPALHCVLVGGVGVDQQHFDLASVTGIDQPGSVQTGNAVLQREAAAGKHQTCVSVGQSNRGAGRDERSAAAGGEHGTDPRREVDAGVAGPGVGGDTQFGIQTNDRDVKHAADIILQQPFGRDRRTQPRQPLPVWDPRAGRVGVRGNSCPDPGGGEGFSSVRGRSVAAQTGEERDR